MKWLKKINQLFTHKELRDDVEASSQEEEEYVTEQQHIGARPLEEQQLEQYERPALKVTTTADKGVAAQKEAQQKKAAFRFPLIPDEEEAYMAPPMSDKQEESVEPPQEQQDRLNIVLEPEPHAQGIRELLAQRQHGKKRQQAPYRPMPLSDVVVEEEPVFKKKLAAEEPAFETRRFVPTVVPSPIFGYGEPTELAKKPPTKEPSTINQLLDKHRQETQQHQAQQTELVNERQLSELAQKSILQTVEMAYDGLNKGEKKLPVAQQEVEPLYEPAILEQDIIQLPQTNERQETEQETYEQQAVEQHADEDVLHERHDVAHEQQTEPQHEAVDLQQQATKPVQQEELELPQAEAAEQQVEQNVQHVTASERVEENELVKQDEEDALEPTVSEQQIEEAEFVQQHKQDVQQVPMFEQKEENTFVQQNEEEVQQTLVSEQQLEEAELVQHDEISELPQVTATEQEAEQPEQQTSPAEQQVAPEQLEDEQQVTTEEIELVERQEDIETRQAETFAEEVADDNAQQTEAVQHVDELTPLVVEVEHDVQAVTEQEPVSMQLQHAYVEDLVVNTLQVGEVTEPMHAAEAASSTVAVRTEKPRPFNVVMLKSDKEKLEKKEALQSIIQQADANVARTFVAKEPFTAIKKQEPNVATFDGEVIDEERLDEPFMEQPSPAEPIVETCDETDEHEQVAEQATSSHEHRQPDIKDDEQDGHSPFLEQAPQQDVQEKVDEEPYVPEPNPVRPYTKPSEAFLVPPEVDLQDTEWMEEQGERLVEALSHFQVKAQIESIVQGPAVTQFEITVGQGTKVSKVRNLSDDLKLALAARDIRIQAPIPGKNTIGIEIPNRLSRAVRLSEVTSSETFTSSSSPLEAALGLDLTGAPVTLDLRKMPHGLIAGATGSGKSVCINSILVSLLYKAAPHELKLLLIDPKMVELAPFNHIPHLVSPVITDVKAATAALKWAVDEMERRYQLFAHMGVRDLERYNKLADKNEQPGHKLPYILIVIDELADLMMMAPHDVEEAICRIAQKARACGIHLIVATQRPSVDVITGLIKSNIPTRIAFMVSSQIDSRTILDSVGAERLLGRGDMLYLGNGQSAAVRLQGTFVTDDEIEDIIEHVRAQGEPDYMFQQEELLRKTELAEEADELFEEVCRFVYERQSASTSSIQRHYRIGYSRAARLVDMLEAHGFVSEAKTGNKPRDVFITQEEIENMFA